MRKASFTTVITSDPNILYISVCWCTYVQYVYLMSVCTSHCRWGPLLQWCAVLWKWGHIANVWHSVLLCGRPWISELRTCSCAYIRTANGQYFVHTCLHSVFPLLCYKRWHVKTILFLTDISLDPHFFGKEESCQQDSCGREIPDINSLFVAFLLFTAAANLFGNFLSPNSFNIAGSWCKYIDFVKNVFID